MNEMENQPDPPPINGAVHKPLTEDQITAATVAELQFEVMKHIAKTKTVPLDIMMATIRIQQHQIKALISVLVERHDELIEPLVNLAEFNRRVRENCQQEIDTLKGLPNIQIAQGVARSIRPGP